MHSKRLGPLCLLFKVIQIQGNGKWQWFDQLPMTCCVWLVVTMGSYQFQDNSDIVQKMQIFYTHNFSSAPCYPQNFKTQNDGPTRWWKKVWWYLQWFRQCNGTAWWTDRTIYYLRAVGRKVLWSSACVCVSVCAHCVCPQDISRTGSWITTKFGGWDQGVNL